MQGITALGAVLALALGTATATARATPSDALPARAIEVASAQWPDSRCRGREAVIWTSQEALDREHPGERLGAVADPPTCSVQLSQEARGFSGPRLCALLQHEFGHLAGHMHGDDPADVMYHGTIPWTVPCTIAFPPPRAGTPGWRCLLKPGALRTFVWQCRRVVRASSSRCRRGSRESSRSSVGCRASGFATAPAARRPRAA